jgi:hypothetical protein
MRWISEKRFGGLRRNGPSCKAQVWELDFPAPVWNLNSLSPPLTSVAQLSPKLFSFVKGVIQVFWPKLV